MKILDTNEARLAFDKLARLSSALEECGISSTLTVDEEFICLRADIPEIWGGLDAELQIGAASYSNFELDPVISTEVGRAKFKAYMEELERARVPM